MSQSAPNPLRPYYIPPTSPYDSLPPAPPPASTSSAPLGAGNSLGSLYAGYNGTSAPNSFSILSDIQEYGEYLETPTVKEVLKGLVDQALTNYALLLMRQPFEVSKTVLQCMIVPKVEGGGKNKLKGVEERDFDDAASDASDNSDVPYFTDNLSDGDSLPPTRPAKTQKRKVTDRAGYVVETPIDEDLKGPWQIKAVRSGGIGEMLKELWNKEGAWGIWKGQNSTFIYTVLMSTLESWTSSFLSAVLSLPDPGMTEIAESAYPLASLGVAVAASAITAMILSPLDIVRTRLILTPCTDRPRNLIPCLRTLKSYTIPASLVLPTTLHASLPALISLGTPYFLRSRLGIDPVVNPAAFKFLSFISSTVELFVRLPLETVLRRAQIAEAKPPRTIVNVGRYAGVFGTMWLIVKEEEGGKYGFEGLVRGWRVGVWGNVGVLGLGLFGVQQQGAGEGF
ncbi:hypothetical protein RUND412_002734 [Rhizina undulata]